MASKRKEAEALRPDKIEAWNWHGTISALISICTRRHRVHQVLWSGEINSTFWGGMSRSHCRRACRLVNRVVSIPEPNVQSATLSFIFLPKLSLHRPQGHILLSVCPTQCHAEKLTLSYPSEHENWRLMSNTLLYLEF